MLMKSFLREGAGIVRNRHYAFPRRSWTSLISHGGGQRCQGQMDWQCVCFVRAGPKLFHFFLSDTFSLLRSKLPPKGARKLKESYAVLSFSRSPCFCCYTWEPTQLHHLNKQASKAGTALKIIIIIKLQYYFHKMLDFKMPFYIC